MDTVIDSGLFHVFDDADRARYVTSLAGVLEPGGTCYLMCFSDRQPGDFGPRRVTRDELTAAFADDWVIDAITADNFTVSADLGGRRPGVAGHPPPRLTQATGNAASSPSVMLPGARRSAANWLASRCSSSLTGVGTPCSRPSRTISPFR